MDISFLAGAKFQNKIWFSAMNLNALFTFDCNTHETKFVKYFTKEKVRNSIHSYAYLYQDTIWFVPWQGKYLAKFNIVSQDITYFDIPAFDGHGFIEPVVFEDRELYLIPSGIDIGNLVKVDMQKSTVEDCGDVLHKRLTLCAGAYIYEKKIYIISASGKIYPVYDIEKKEIQIIEEESSYGYQSLLRIKNKVLLIPREVCGAKMIDISGGNTICEEISCGSNYYTGTFLNGVAWMFPFDMNRELVGISIDDPSRRFITKKLHLRKEKGRGLNIRIIPSDDAEYWVNTNFGELWKVDGNFDILESYCLSIDGRQWREIVKDRLADDDVLEWFSGKIEIYEEYSGLSSLPCFVDAVSNTKLSERNHNNKITKDISEGVSNIILKKVMK